MERRNKRLAGIFVIVLIVLTVPGFFGWRFVSISYHRYKMRSAYLQIQNDQRAGSDYESHRAALIKLGYFVKHQFYLKRITAQSQEFGQLLSDLPRHFPDQIGKVEGHGYIYGEPTFVVIWMPSAHAMEIGDFIQQRDAK